MRWHENVLCAFHPGPRGNSRRAGDALSRLEGESMFLKLPMRFRMADKGGAAGAAPAVATPATAPEPVSPAATPAEKAVTDDLSFAHLIPGAEALAAEHDKAQAAAAKAEATPAPEPVPTEPVQAEPEPEPEAHEDEEIALEGLKPHEQKMLKRINKLTAQRDEGAKEITALKAEIATLKTQPKPAASTPQNGAQAPLSDVMTLEDLTARETQAEQLRDWLIEHLDGGTIRNGDHEVEISPEQAKQYFAQYDRMLRKEIPQRRAYLQTFAVADTQALEKFPALADPNSAESKDMAHILSAVPELKRVPDYKLLIGYILRGFAQDAEAAKKAAEAKPTPAAPAAKPAVPAAKAVPLAPAPPVSSPPPARISPGNNTRLAQAEEQLVKQGGGREALEEFFATSRA